MTLTQPGSGPLAPSAKADLLGDRIPRVSALFRRGLGRGPKYAQPPRTRPFSLRADLIYRDGARLLATIREAGWGEQELGRLADLDQPVQGVLQSQFGGAPFSAFVPEGERLVPGIDPKDQALTLFPFLFPEMMGTDEGLLVDVIFHLRTANEISDERRGALVSQGWRFEDLTDIRGRIHDAPSAATPPATPSPVLSDPAERLRRLQSMRDQSLISEEEFDAKRQEILADL